MINHEKPRDTDISFNINAFLFTFNKYFVVLFPFMENKGF